MRSQMNLTWQGDDVDVDIEFSPGYHTPASFKGHPDLWTPEEGEAPEITSVKISDTGEEILSRLSKSEVQRIEKSLERVQEDDHEPDYEPDDIGDDDWREAQEDWERSHG